MTKILKSSIIVVAFLVAFGVAFSQAWAEDVKFTVTSYITKTELLPVPDVEGHSLMLGERRGLAVFEGGGVATYHTRFICDLTKFHGGCDGYTNLTYMDKSQTIVKYHLTAEVPQGKKIPVVKGKGDYIKGTGKFEGIKGSISFKGYYITPYAGETKGDMLVNVSGSYTLPSQ